MSDLNQPADQAGAVMRPDILEWFLRPYSCGPILHLFLEIIKEILIMASQSHVAAGQAHISDVMTRRPAFLSADQTVDQAAKIMAELGVGALPVCENDQLIGMLTDRDITVRCTATGKAPTECRVTDAMSPKVQWCSEDDTVDVARHKMVSKRIRRLPVVDRDHHLVGMLSLGDLATKSGDAGEVLKKVSTPSTAMG